MYYFVIKSQILLFVVSFFILGVITNIAQAQTVGEFKVSDYGSGLSDVGAYLRRGYQLQVVSTTTVTHLIGGANNTNFEIGLFTMTLENGTYTLDSLLGSVAMTTAGNEQVWELGSPIELVPGEDYFLAQGRVSGTTGNHYFLNNLNVQDLLDGSPRIASWSPTDGRSVRFSGTMSAAALVGNSSNDTNNDRPRMGFLFESDVSSAVMSTLPATIDGTDVILNGRIDDAGDGVTSQYLEWDTNDTFSNSTIYFLGATSTNAVQYSVAVSLFDSGTTYYVRAFGVNDAGRTNGTTTSFAIRTLEYVADENGSITGTTNQVVFDGGDGTAVTAVPDTGFDFVMWSDGLLTAARTDTGVIQNVTLTATFATSTYSILFSAGSGGAISGAAEQTVEHGSSTMSIEAVPNSGFEFVRWSDGSITNPRTLTNVIEDQNLKAEFRSTARTRSGTSVVSQVQNLESYGNQTEADRLRQLFPNAFSAQEASSSQTSEVTRNSQLLQLRSQLQQLLQQFQSVTGRTFMLPQQSSSQITAQGNTNVSNDLQVRDLERGDIGNEVQQLQRILNNAGFTLSDEGAGSPGQESTFFGDRTQNALIRFQGENNITPATGYFGSISRSVMTQQQLSGLWW